MDASPSGPRDSDGQVVFGGRAGEFFGIWVVNVLLTLVTLGIYSAWAKVRTRQYFYASTRLGGAAFDYLARPVQILAGRLIAVAALVLYSVVSNAFPVTEPWLTLSLMPLLPWVIVKALAFNARNTAHRGLRFDFHGGYGGALIGYLLLPVLGVLSLGLLLPVGGWYRARYLVGHSAYGATRFDFQQPLPAFYAAYARGLLLGLALFVPVLGGVVALYGAGLVEDLRLLPAYFEQIDEAVEPDAEAEAAPPPESAQDDTARSTPLDAAERERAERLFIALMLLLYPLLGLAAVVWIYLGTAIANLTWNGTRLGPLGFQMRLRFGYMLWLKTSNLVAIVLSFGLAVPWTRIRSARYLTSRLRVLGMEHVEGLLGAPRASGSVVGEELGEAFDVDLGF